MISSAISYIDDVEELIQHIKNAKIDFSAYFGENTQKNTLADNLNRMIDSTIERFEELKRLHESGAESLGEQTECYES